MSSFDCTVFTSDLGAPSLQFHPRRWVATHPSHSADTAHGGSAGRLGLFTCPPLMWQLKLNCGSHRGVNNNPCFFRPSFPMSLSYWPQCPSTRSICAWAPLLGRAGEMGSPSRCPGSCVGWLSYWLGWDHSVCFLASTLCANGPEQVVSPVNQWLLGLAPKCPGLVQCCFGWRKPVFPFRCVEQEMQP